MNKVKGYCDAAWSVMSLTVVVSLLASLLYWTVLQRPPLTTNVEGLTTTYTAYPGTQVYLENPIYPPDTRLEVAIKPILVSSSGTGTYRLPPVEARDGFKPSLTDQKMSFARPGYPVYGVFIPSYVKPGKYTYQATATYRLNIFRTVTLNLPELTVVVE